MRPDVVHVEQQTGRVVLRQLQLQRVVVRDGVVEVPADTRECRVRTKARCRTRVRASRCRHPVTRFYVILAQLGRVSDLVQVRRELQVEAVAADTRNRYGEVPGKLMLNFERVFVDLAWRDVVRRVSWPKRLAQSRPYVGGRASRRLHVRQNPARRSRGRIEVDQRSRARPKGYVGSVARAVRPKAQSAAVNVLTVIVRVESETTADDGVRFYLPGKAETRQEDVPNRLLQRGSVILAGKPHGTRRAGESANRVDYVRVEPANLVVLLAHARCSHITQAEIDREIGLKLVIVLDESLRALQPHSARALVVRFPGLNVA